MQLYFIRHAQSMNNAIYDSTGSYEGRSADPELTPVGCRQAELLAQHLLPQHTSHVPPNNDFQNSAGFNLTHLYTSPMLRAVDTGVAVARQLGLPLYYWRDLHEGGGLYLDRPDGSQIIYPGYGRSDFHQRFPELVLPDDLDDSGWWNQPYETRPERRLRACRVIDQLLHVHGESDHRVALISHGGFYSHFIAALFEMNDDDVQPSAEAEHAYTGENVILRRAGEIWLIINNTAITRLDFAPQRVALVYSNRVAHLPPEWIT